MSYELPQISYIGEAEAVILGLVSFGSDLDGSWIGDIFDSQDEYSSFPETK
jgi:hypothetical protein